jgi:chorismate-pyruvate lyase
MASNTYHDQKKSTERVVFRSDGFVKDWAIKCSEETSMPMSSIPPFLRTLLVTDGTISKTLEAFFWEPVETEVIAQEIVAADLDLPWLDAKKGDQVLTRDVELKGKTSGQIYATAFSTIRPDVIPPEFRDKLLSGEVSIGVLIRDSGMESYREILKFGSDQHQDDLFDDLENGIESIHRTYCVYLGGKPALLITERFSLSFYSRYGDRRDR